MKYREEIDGLRAIAVLLVISHHFGITLFQGGFIGVDIFFVISGFLITSIVKKEIENKEFSFRNFYKKRFLRLAPAYYLIIIICFILSVFLLAPLELISFSKSTLFSSVFAANFYVLREVGGYFSTKAENIPLLHLWSLGVEEQFYLIWPTFLIILTKYLRKGTLSLIILIAVLGCILAQIISIKLPAVSYFMFPTRAFELLIGASLAFIRPVKVKKTSSNIISFIGLTLIGFSSIYINEHKIFPGLYALFPCIGSALIIYISNNKSFIKSLLSAAPLRFVGKISYPLYLWHWPLIVFYKIRFGEISTLMTIVMISTMIVLSYLTFRFLEKPLQDRFKNSLPFEVTLRIYIIPTAIVTLLGIMIIRQNGLENRFDSNILKTEKYINSASYVARRDCLYTPANELPPLSKCILGNEKANLEVLLVGDSHANHFANMIDFMLDDANLKGYEISQSATLFLPGVDRYELRDGHESIVSNFRTRNDKIQEELKTHKYKYVILGGSYADATMENHYKNINDKTTDNLSTIENGTSEAIDLINKNGAIPFIIKGSPLIYKYDQYCPLRKAMFKNIECNYERELHDQYFNNWNAMLNRLKLRYPNLRVIDIEEFFCDEKRCFLEKNDIPLYLDNKHINFMASGELGRLYIERHDNPFK